MTTRRDQWVDSRYWTALGIVVAVAYYWALFVLLAGVVYLFWMAWS